MKPLDKIAQLAADLQISQLPEKLNAELADQIAVDDATNVTWKLTLAKIIQLSQSQLKSAANSVYVSPADGSDITGDGSVLNPYASISYAQNQVASLATDLNPYDIILTSEIYEEPSGLELHPFVYIVGNNATINVTGSVTLSSQWGNYFGGASVNLFIKNCLILATGGITLDFSASAVQPVFISLNDVLIQDLFTVIGTGDQSLNLKDCGNFQTGLALNFLNLSGYVVSGGNILSFTALNDSVIAGMIGFIFGALVSGVVDLNSLGGNALQQFVFSSLVFNSISVNNPTTFLLTDCDISAIPTLSNGATWVPLSLASGVVMQYTPVNFTYVGGTVNDYFQGVDNKFGELSYTARVNATSSVALSTPAPHEVFIDMVSTGQSINLPEVNVAGIPTMGVGQKIYFEVSTSSEDFELRYYNGTPYVALGASRAFNLVLNDNSTPQGTWVPEYLVISVNELDGSVILNGLNLNAEYAAPSNYTPTSVYIEGHLEGINAALGSGVLPGASSYANAGYNKNLTTAGGISFANTTSYLPFLTLSAPASYSKTNLFSVETDGNLHTVFRCLDPTGGTYILEMTIRFVSINNNGVVDYFINFGINGFSAANIDSTQDFPLYTYGTTDNAQITQTVVFTLTCAYNDVIYAPVIRSGTSSVPFDTFCKQIFTQANIFKVANSNSSDFPLSVVTTTSATLSTGNRYLCTNGALTTLTLPTTAAVGGVIRIDGVGTGGFRIAQNAGQKVSLLSVSTTTGGAGQVDSVDANSGLTLQCGVANTEFFIIQPNGNFILI